MPKFTIILAHLCALIAAPFWLMTFAFAPMILTGNAPNQTMTYIVMTLLYLGPLLSAVFLIALWVFMAQKNGARAKTTAWALIGTQAVAGLFMLFS